jgi:hypothetical protein
MNLAPGPRIPEGLEAGLPRDVMFILFVLAEARQGDTDQGRECEEDWAHWLHPLRRIEKRGVARRGFDEGILEWRFRFLAVGWKRNRSQGR